MNRYRTIPIISTPENPKRRYATVKYPEILFDLTDIFVYTGRGDRYDLLADTYYEDSTLWWVISKANYNLSQDSLIPPVGAQIRIPGSSRIAAIVAEFENLNIFI